MKWERTYNEFGYMNMENQFDWNSTVNDWSEAGRTMLFYHDDGILSSKRTLSWDPIKLKWNFLWKSNYGYDVNGNLSIEENFFWDTVKNNWMWFERNEYSYNTDGDISILYSFYYNTNIYDWSKASNTYYYYSNISVGARQISSNNVMLFPNPTSGVINISGLNYSSEIMIYNINGELIKSAQNTNHIIDISELPSGVYILNLISKDMKVVRTVVKE